MASWRDRIIANLTVPGARLLLVADPDGLLRDEMVLAAIQAQGMDVMAYEDPLAFRVVYEERYRPGLAQPAGAAGGEARPVVVVVHDDAAALDRLPYDLLRQGTRLTFGLSGIFPTLSYPILRTLDVADLDALHAAYRQQPKAVGSMPIAARGEQATRDFLLRYVFDIDPSTILEASDLLAMLLRRHYSDQVIPPGLIARLLEVLRRKHQFDHWPLDRLLVDRRFFLRFLQERWPLFLNRLAAREGAEMRETDANYLEITGPAELPFGQQDVRPLIDSLFLDGLLLPVEHEDANVVMHNQPWAGVGVKIDPEADRVRRGSRLLDALDKVVPNATARHQDWLAFAWRWAELSALWHQGSTSSAPSALGPRYDELQRRIDAAFLTWLLGRYAGLYSQPALSPVMVHHIPRFLARQRQDTAGRKPALLVLDGMALEQWVIVREVLSRPRPELQLAETATFAWIPTVTSVSRQALFSGKLPQAFPATIESTNNDKAGWVQWWHENGLNADAVYYMRHIHHAADLATLRQHLEGPKLRIVGLVADGIDQITHGETLGMAGMHAQVRHWADTGFLAELLDLLLDRGYTVYLTADHGNVEAVGAGKPTEGAIADTKGERVRVYPDEALRAIVGAKFPHAIPWPAVGLPSSYVPLLAGDRTAFVTAGERIVAHGGCALEEVIVPFVTIERRIPS